MSQSVAVAAELARSLDAATAELDPPFAVLDVGVLRANAAELTKRASGKPVRIASKSVRCRTVIDQTLTTPGIAGLMTFSLREALWLRGLGHTDLLMGYPTADRDALRELAARPESITLMTDSVEQLAFIRAVVGPEATGIRVCIDVDASLRIGPIHLGVRRSPVRTAADAQLVAGRAVELGFRVVGVMFYEAQIAGLADSGPVIRMVKARSAAELAVRRGSVVAAVQQRFGALEFVNAGGTGSLEVSSADPSVTEVTAGSGLYMPTLFDNYRAFRAHPSVFFALAVVRRPARGIVTLFGGGYVASGPTGNSRVPLPVTPSGLKLIGAEGVGEVQTPVRGEAADRLKIGDRVWFRHAKAGEMLERFPGLHLIQNGSLVGFAPSYRGEGQSFG